MGLTRAIARGACPSSGSDRQDDTGIDGIAAVGAWTSILFYPVILSKTLRFAPF